MDACPTPNLELKLILETHVVIINFEENVVYVCRVGTNRTVRLLVAVLENFAQLRPALCSFLLLMTG
jgi:hypothetical protein